MHASPSALLPDLTGEFIDDGSLLLVRLLGSGSFGKVYKALDTTSPADDPVYYAVKCMHLCDLGSLEGEMQAKELRIHAMLDDHPGVISLHRICATEEFVFAILELATGGDLYSAMVDRKCFRGNSASIKQALGEILDAVEFCHRNGVYHRDIKPENILCSPAGTDIRLADFGLATENKVSTSFGCGTRNYTTPESMDCESSGYSPRHSDLWAVSIIFAGMISGRSLWASADMSDPWYAAFRANEDAHLRALKVSRPANDLLKRCFHLDPRRRPTLEEFREAVNAIDSFSIRDKYHAPAASCVRPPSVVRPPAPVALPSVPAADDYPTPKPASPPIYAPKPVTPTLSPALSASSSPIALAPVAATSSSPSSSPAPPLSAPSSASSAPSAADSKPPATPAMLPADAADAQLSTVSSLAIAIDPKQQLRVPPPPPQCRYLDRLHPILAAPAIPADQVPAMPRTRRQLFAGRRTKIRAWIRGARESYERKTKNTS